MVLIPSFLIGVNSREGSKYEEEVVCITICPTIIYCISCLFREKDSKQAGTSKSGTPKDGGTLTIGVSDNPETMNPLYANDRVSLTVQQALYAPLYHMEDGKKKFVLAESFTPSEDQLTWTLKLKDNLKWHDGKKITSDDIAFTFQSILDEKQNSSSRENFVLRKTA